ncbi:MAG: iron-sulfur cluster repair protein YtfE [Bermanella sp.]|jgi:regulator of cell morphogenesis and NO signaling
MTIIHQTLGQLARDLPGATAVFHKLKLDFCCAGDQTLEEAIERKQLNSDEVVASLMALSELTEQASTWNEAENDALIEHILTRFHDVHREQLPELIRLSQRVERVHGGNPDCPVGLSAHLESMLEELEVHMQKEETILFPMILRGMGEMAVAPVSMMRHEHEGHGDVLAGVHQLTNDITLPEGACNTWRALYTGLAALSNDLMEHIHLENNVLFNRIDGKLGAAKHG